MINRKTKMINYATYLVIWAVTAIYCFSDYFLEGKPLLGGLALWLSLNFILSGFLIAFLPDKSHASDVVAIFAAVLVAIAFIGAVATITSLMFTVTMVALTPIIYMLYRNAKGETK